MGVEKKGQSFTAIGGVNNGVSVTVLKKVTCVC